MGASEGSAAGGFLSVGGSPPARLDELMALALALLDFFVRFVCTVVVVFVVLATLLAVFTEDFVAAEVGGGSSAAFA